MVTEKWVNALFETARQLADEMKTTWIALFVDTSAVDWKARLEREQATKTLDLAKSMGAETVIVSGKSIAETVVDYAVKNNVARMVVGKPVRSRWQELVFGSNTEEIIRLSGWIDIILVTEEKSPESAPSKFFFFIGKGYTPYLGSTALAIAITIINLLLQKLLDPMNYLMFYLFAIVLTAVAWGQKPALYTTGISIVLFDLFFMITPTSIIGDNPQYPIFLLVFLIVAIAISIIVTREHMQVEFLKTQAAQLASLYEFIRDLAAAVDVDAISKIIVEHVRKVFNWNSIVMIPKNENLIVRASSTGVELDDKDLSIALWAFNQGSVAGFNSETLSMSTKQFLPFTTERGVVGVIGIQPMKPIQPSPEELKQDQFMQIFIDQAAWAIERANAMEKAENCN